MPPLIFTFSDGDMMKQLSATLMTALSMGAVHAAAAVKQFEVRGIQSPDLTE